MKPLNRRGECRVSGKRIGSLLEGSLQLPVWSSILHPDCSSAFFPFAINGSDSRSFIRDGYLMRHVLTSLVKLSVACGIACVCACVSACAHAESQSYHFKEICSEILIMTSFVFQLYRSDSDSSTLPKKSPFVRNTLERRTLRYKQVSVAT